MNTFYLSISLIFAVMTTYNAFHVTFSNISFIIPLVGTFFLSIAFFYMAINDKWVADKDTERSE